jgi:hypothetical protein
LDVPADSIGSAERRAEDLTAVAEPDWYRAPTWAAAAGDTFEQRLRLARPYNRPQYLRIQAVTLLESGDPHDRQAAIALLHRLLDQYPEHFEVPFAHELLAQAYRAEGDLALAEHHLRHCMATWPPSRSGTTGLADLTLAELLVEGGDPAGFREAAALLDASELASHLVFHAQVFRYYLVRARLADRVGDPRRRAYAQHALQVAAITTPQFPRHPDVGLVHTSAAVLAELREIAKA